jgi:hypothetical protein
MVTFDEFDNVDVDDDDVMELMLLLVVELVDMDNNCLQFEGDVKRRRW